MQTNPDFQKCLTFINCHLQPSVRPVGLNGGKSRWQAVTISRQTGAGAHTVAEELAKILQAQSAPDRGAWTVFDRNVVEKVLEDHHLPSRMAQFLTEDRISGISDTLDELFGLHPPSATLVRNTADTMLRLAELGNVILIGRGANIITSRLPAVFHVRLVGSLEKRIEYVCRENGLSPRKARQYVHDQDRRRRRFVKKNFHKNADDPLLYHLIINTDLVPYDEAARIIANAMAREPKTIPVPNTEPKTAETLAYAELEED